VLRGWQSCQYWWLHGSSIHLVMVALASSGPIAMNNDGWPLHHNPLCRPTWAYMWDCVEPWHGDSVDQHNRHLPLKYEALST
jgi:hypothetical protein